MSVPAQIPPNLAVVERLRDVMDDLARVRFDDGLDLRRAQFDADTSAINRLFLDSLIEILPLDPYENAEMAVESPVALPPARIHACFIGTGESQLTTRAAGVIIGEQAPGEDDVEQRVTKLLVAPLATAVDYFDDETGQSARHHQVVPVEVSSRAWAIRQAEATARLTQGVSHEVIKSTLKHTPSGAIEIDGHSASKAGFTQIVRPDSANLLGHLEIAVGFRGKHVTRPTKRGKIRACFGNTRDLQTSDFEEYDVIRNVEIMVAAFGVGKAFDLVKAAREAKMPKIDPISPIIGVDDYRAAVESPYALELNPLLDPK